MEFLTLTFMGLNSVFLTTPNSFVMEITVLREHFRCMPEIIEFSNRNFYAPDGNGLYPLKQYSQKRLEPLESVFCKSGYTEGKSLRNH